MTDPTERKAENDKPDAAAQQTPNPANPKPYVMPDDPEEQQADPLVAAQKEAAEYKDKLLRTLAEMENLRRRTERDGSGEGKSEFAKHDRSPGERGLRGVVTSAPCS